MKQLTNSDLQRISGASFVVDILDPGMNLGTVDPGFSMDMFTPDFGMTGFDPAFSMPIQIHLTLGNNFDAAFSQHVINQGGLGTGALIDPGFSMVMPA